LQQRFSFGQHNINDRIQLYWPAVL
jgi:hypothetical protein